jgi:uncharacterized protein (TIGR02246 family)
MNDGSGLEQVVFSYFGAFGRGDVDAILSHYADDAVFMPAGMPSVVGREALRAAYERTLTQVRILPGGSSHAHDVITLGELAWVHTESRAIALNPSTGEQSPGHFREVFLLRRVDADWKIWRYTFNTIG